jgi:hypothetical protein
VNAFLALALCLPAAAGEASWGWRETLSPHFLIKHQDPWLPKGLTMSAEKVHSRLRMDLGMFSPWMAKERINLYIYADKESYLGGEFSPPEWSNGVAVYGRRAVAMPAMKDPRQLVLVLAHETTHLLFDSYWREQRKTPPHWLNEGLAMLEEADSPEKPETSVWYQKMADADPKRFPDLEAFFEISPQTDLHGDKEAVGEWYVQAYAVTHFLLRKHSRLQFKSFCGHLRDGRPVAEALWLTYRYRKVGDLDRKWRAWVGDPLHDRRVAALASSQRDIDPSLVERGAKTSSGSFKPFKIGER